MGGALGCRIIGNALNSWHLHGLGGGVGGAGGHGLGGGVAGAGGTRIIGNVQNSMRSLGLGCALCALGSAGGPRIIRI